MQKPGGECDARSYGYRRLRDEAQEISRSQITKSLVKPYQGAWALS